VKAEITLQQGIPIEKAREDREEAQDSKLKGARLRAAATSCGCGPATATSASRHKLLRESDFGIRHAVHQLPHETDVARRIESHWIPGLWAAGSAAGGSRAL